MTITVIFFLVTSLNVINRTKSERERRRELIVRANKFHVFFEIKESKANVVKFVLML